MRFWGLFCYWSGCFEIYYDNWAARSSLVRSAGKLPRAHSCYLKPFLVFVSLSVIPPSLSYLLPPRLYLCCSWRLCLQSITSESSSFYFSQALTYFQRPSWDRFQRPPWDIFQRLLWDRFQRPPWDILGTNFCWQLQFITLLLPDLLYRRQHHLWRFGRKFNRPCE